MRFEEKLVALRKQNLLSQEQLAEKLNVTRQTISKWELGQSKPDMDKLTAMSKLFNVNIDTLTNDDVSLDDKKKLKENESPVKKKSSNNFSRKIILYVLIIIFAFSCGTLVLRLGNSVVKETQRQTKQKEKEKKELEQKEKEEQELERKEQEREKQEQEERQKNFEKNNFNSSFEMYQGTKSGMFAKNQVDNVIKNNNKNSDHLIEIVFDGTSYGTSSDSIKEIKDKIKEFNGYKFQEYEISLDYSDDGYVNKITIETK